MSIKKKLKRSGNKKVNSTSYKIKNTQTIEKFKLICIFISDIALKPHSYTWALDIWFFFWKNHSVNQVNNQKIKPKIKTFWIKKINKILPILNKY